MEAKYPFAGMMQGSLMMMLFGIGTAPAMLLVGKVVNTISNSMRKRVYRVASIIMIMMGVWFVLKGW